jgi:hypothetical protein
VEEEGEEGREEPLEEEGEGGREGGVPAATPGESEEELRPCFFQLS